MRNIYFAIWADAIINIRKNPNNKTDWKVLSILLMTIINTLNLAVVLMLLSYFFGVNVIWIKVTLFRLESMNSFISFIFQFALPFIVLNYFLIFFKGKYKLLIDEYPNRNGRLFAAYLLGSIGLFVVSVVSYMLMV